MKKKNPDFMAALLLAFVVGIAVTGVAHEAMDYQHNKTASLTASINGIHLESDARP